LVTNRKNLKPPAPGFTLIELLVVLTIAGLLTTLVAPLYSKAVPGVRLKVAARDFAISLRDARSRAISTGRQTDLKLIEDPPSYMVGDTPAISLPRGVFMTAYNYFTAPQGSLAGADALSGQDNVFIRFYPDGSSNGSVVKVSNSGAAYRIDVSWLMGDVNIFEIENDER